MLKLNGDLLKERYARMCKNIEKYSIEDLITKLKYDNHFYPFGHLYDKKRITDYFNNIKNTKIDNPKHGYIYNILSVIPLLANFNKDTICTINKYINKINIPSEDLITLITAYTNYYFVRTSYNIINKEPKNYTYFEDLLLSNNLAAKQCENLVTFNNLFFNYLNYYKTTGYYKKEEKSDITLDNINKLYMFLQILCGYKDFYETCLFEKYNIKQIRNDKDIFYIATMYDKDYSKIRTISDIRQSKYIFGYLYFLDNNPHLKTKISNFVLQKIKFKKITNIRFENNKINYELDEASNASEFLDEYNKLNCFVMPFYQFMINNNKYSELINDYLILYSKFQDFFKQIQIKCNTSDIKSLDDLKNIPAKINKNILKNYLLNTTTYPQETIQKFLKILGNKNTINFFKKPLLPIGNDYLFHLLNITGNITVNNIDDWLEINNVNLQERGIIFEDYVKAKTKEILKNKNYKFFIPDIKKFKNSNENEEEIDLIISLENIILLIELKCIKYPIEYHDIENAKQRLLEGVSQIKRKMVFVQDNTQLFKSKQVNIENKEIIPLVITNNPNFTGLIVNNVPIIDFELFNNYIDVGKFITFKIDNKSFKEDKSVIYYNNQREFELKIKDFMNNPIPLKDIEEKIELSKTQIIHDNKIFKCLNPKLYIERYN